MPETTLRYHVYQEPSHGHNQREPEVIKRENASSKSRWIDPAGHEVWGPGQTEAEAYGELFGAAIEAYNAGQKRKDRRMTVEDYRASVRADTRGRENKAIAAANKRAEESGRPQDVRKAKGKHTSHEVVLSLGNVAPQRDADNRLVLDSSGRRVLPNKLPEDACRMVYQAYIESWQERNPNFYLYRADYHDGEWFRVKRGGEDLTGRGGPDGQWVKGVPHPHLSFIPWAEGYKKGLSRQVSTGKALAAMGFKDYQDADGRTVTAWEQWQQREQSYIGELVEKYLPGYTIVKEGQRQTALSAKEYQEVQDMREDAQQLQAEASGYFAEAARLVSDVEDAVQEAKADREAAGAAKVRQEAQEAKAAADRAEAARVLQKAQEARQEAQEDREAAAADRTRAKAELAEAGKIRREAEADREAAGAAKANQEAQEAAAVADRAKAAQLLQEAGADRQAAAADRTRAKAELAEAGKVRQEAEADRDALQGERQALADKTVQVQAELDAAVDTRQSADRAKQLWGVYSEQQRGSYDRWYTSKRHLILSREKRLQEREAAAQAREDKLAEREAEVKAKEDAMDAMARDRYKRQLAAQQRQRDEQYRQRVQDTDTLADGLTAGPDGWQRKL